MLEYYLVQCEEEIGKPAVTMNKEEKMRALQYLDEKGVLQITKANVRLCQFFQILKFTLYHYLDEIREKRFC
ncbi:MAG TPA: helix-turn-helix domain-containing protein [Candidatus Coprocola pullicola]|nr:helix-turn-helix domain-containing protein [Candidatus Coprocola pullicola]